MTLDQASADLVAAALKEDIGRGDVTSLACLGPDRIRARVVAKSSGVVSGLKPAALAFHLVDSANVFRPILADGDPFQPGDIIAEIEGLDQTILVAERVALNFLGRLSGVASLTRQFVSLVEAVSDRCRLLDTRKTTPGFRLLEKAAVVHGGGCNHRVGLYDMMLVKDNHIAAAGSISKAIERAREYLASSEFTLQFDVDPATIEIEVEVSTERELVEALGTGITRLLLDNQTPDGLRQLVGVARGKVRDALLEASGNVNLDTVAAIAQTGVDFISVGALTHSAPTSDFSLKVVED